MKANKMITVICATFGTKSDSLTACRAILDWQSMAYDERVSVRECMILSKGKINPTGGFVMLTHDETVLCDAFDLMNWIDANGLRHI